MIFVQDAGRRSQTLRFEPGRLVVASADAASAREIALGYCDIDIDAQTSVKPRRGLAFWRPVAGATCYPVVAGRRCGETLEIWRDAGHDAIVAQLTLRWRAARRELVRIDFDADPIREMERFAALMARGLVSAEECAAAVARIVAKAAGQST